MRSSRQPRVCLNVSMNLDERFGGLTSSLPLFCQALTRTGRFTGKLVAFCGDDEVTPPTLDPEAVHRFPAGRLRWARDSHLRRQLAGLIEQSAIVHIHGLWREHSSIAASICRRLNKPYAVSAHGMLEPWALNQGKWKKRAYLAAIEKSVLQCAAGLRALTESEISDYRSLNLTNPVEVLPNGVELPERVAPGIFLQDFPALSGRRIVLFLGRIHPKKGIDILCRAWSGLEKQFPDAILAIAGPDDDGALTPIRQLVADRGIQDRVVFTGMLRGAVKWSALAASSVFALPSHSEGFSIAVLEALGSGLPVIASRACHFPKIAATGSGWEIDADEAQLAAALSRALSLSPEALLEMGRSAKRMIAADFTWPRVGEHAADLFESWAGAQIPSPCSR